MFMDDEDDTMPAGSTPADDAKKDEEDSDNE
jgi:hypothetical protein